MCPFTNPEVKKKYQKEYNEKIRLKKLAEKQKASPAPTIKPVEKPVETILPDSTKENLAPITEKPVATVSVIETVPVAEVLVAPEPAVETPSVMPQAKEPERYELAKPIFPALTFKPEVAKTAPEPNPTKKAVVENKKPCVFSLYTYSLPEILYAREPHLIRLEPLAENIVVANRLVEKKPYTFSLFSYSLAEILFAREPHLIRSF